MARCNIRLRFSSIHPRVHPAVRISLFCSAYLKHIRTGCLRHAQKSQPSGLMASVFVPWIRRSSCVRAHGYLKTWSFVVERCRAMRRCGFTPGGRLWELGSHAADATVDGIADAHLAAKV